MRALNFIGGLPDRVLISIPDPSIPKNRGDRDEYLERLRFYQADRWGQNERPFFKIPDSAPKPTTIETRAYHGGESVVISYPSRYEVRNPALADDFNQYKRNGAGYLNLWRHGDEDRPLVLCIHGFMMGHPKRAERMFRIKKLFNLGPDVALYTLPHHWRRSQGSRRILSPDNLPLSIETFGQNLHDLHSAMLILRQRGYDKIGIIGASMGGLTASLYATTAPLADFMFLVVPVVGMDIYLAPRKKYFTFPIDRDIVEASGRAAPIISALNYKPRFDLDRFQVVMHAGDRMCPGEDTKRWIEAWKIKNVVEVVGGHWLYFDREARGRAWYGWLTKFGYI